MFLPPPPFDATSADIFLIWIIFVCALQNFGFTSTNEQKTTSLSSGEHGASRSSGMSRSSGTSSDVTSVTSEEFCHFSRLDIVCPSGHLLFFHSAVYGRMQIGKCARTDFGFIGCSVSVLDIIDRNCSRQTSCQLNVIEPTFDNRRPCNDELKNYLIVEYSCIRVAKFLPESCDVILSDQILIQTNRNKNVETCGTAAQPWKVVVSKPGQRINITMIFLGSASSVYIAGVGGANMGGAMTKQSKGNVTSSTDCGQTVVIREPLRKNSIEVCFNRMFREFHLYTSETGNVEFFLNPAISAIYDSSVWIVSAVGCPDLQPGVGHSSGLFWVRYSSDRSSADVGCSRLLDPEVSWKLHCIGQSWIGHMGNCSRIAENVSASSNSDEVQLNAVAVTAIWLSISAAVGMCVLLTGLTLHNRINKRRRCDSCRERITIDTTTPFVNDDRPEIEQPDVELATSGDCRLYHAFLHKGLLTTVSFRSAEPGHTSKTCHCVRSLGELTERGSNSDRVMAGTKMAAYEDEDDFSIHKDGCLSDDVNAGKSLLNPISTRAAGDPVDVKHCPHCCSLINYSNKNRAGTSII